MYNIVPDWSQLKFPGGCQTNICSVEGVDSGAEYDEMAAFISWYHGKSKALDGSFISHLECRELARPSESGIDHHIPRNFLVTQKVWEVDFQTKSLGDVNLDCKTR